MAFRSTGAFLGWANHRAASRAASHPAAKPTQAASEHRRDAEVGCPKAGNDRPGPRRSVQTATGDVRPSQPAPGCGEHSCGAKLLTVASLERFTFVGVYLFDFGGMCVKLDQFTQIFSGDRIHYVELPLAEKNEAMCNILQTFHQARNSGRNRPQALATTAS